MNLKTFYIFSSLFFLTSIFSEENVSSIASENLHHERHINSHSKLKGLRFVSSIEKVSGSEIFEGIKIENLFVPKGFEKQMCKFLDQTIDLDLLGKIKQDVSSFYKKKGYLFTFVAIPPQDFKNGNVTVIVLLGNLSDVEVSGNKYCPPSFFKNQMSLKRGEIISEGKINKDSMWLNSNPFRSTTFIFKPGENEADTSLEIDVKEKFPLRVYGTYEHNGYFLAGDNRYMAGINTGWCFLLDQLLDYQFTSGNSVSEYLNHSLDYKMFFPWQNVLKLFWTYSKSDTIEDNDIETKGKGYEIRAHYEIPFVISDSQNSFKLGYEFKHINNFQIYGIDLLVNPHQKDTDISQFLLEYQRSFSGTSGNTSIRSLFYLSPGDMTKYNKKRYFITERPGATPKYVYWRVFIDRTFFLPKKFLWAVSFVFQLSSNKLLPTEQFSLGGYYTVRGYKENQVISDNGVNIRNELRTPSMSFFKDKKDLLQFLAFFDFGRASNVDENVLKKHAINIYSAGAGIRYNLKEYVVLRLDQGFQLKHVHNIADEGQKHMQTHVALTVSY